MPPGGRTTGIVLSDSDCEPDAQGLNHCHNAVQLADGKLILLINTHVMARNRCLGAGDKLSLSAVGRSWMMAVVAHP